MNSTKKNTKNLTMDTLNPNIKAMEFAVRGPLFIRAGEIERELKQGNKKPFSQVTRVNSGDSHAMGQQPITFIRQVLVLVTYPELFNDPRFPEDAKNRAQTILNECRGKSVGAYTDSPGIEIIRRHVAEYIKRRDGHTSDWQNIVLGSGTTDCIKNFLKLLICDVNRKKPGVMIPVPQYPLYSATLAEFNMQQIDYYLNEDKSWELSISELQRSIDEAKKFCAPRAIVVINPGNPTSQILSRKNIEDIIKFAHKENLIIFADEVYQDNVYAKGSTFFSFKKILMEMGEPYNQMELASFMSCSKGFMAECGLRGGYVECINIDPQVKAMYLKALSAMLCPTVLGQTVIDAVVNPPREGEPSYNTYINNKLSIIESLKLRAKIIEETLNSFEGFSCNPVQGGMYAFPQIKMPYKAIEAAKKLGKEPDEFYAFKLLESTGICIVPGSGFGQKTGTYHFRISILPPIDMLTNMLQTFKEFNQKFFKEYA